MRTGKWVRWAIVILLVVLVIALQWANYRFSILSPGGNDFLARWTGAHYWLVEGINPYDDQVSLEAQMLIYGRPADTSKGEDIAHFVYPLPAMVFFAPFGLLPYTSARALWMTLLEISLPILAYLGIRLSRWKVSPAIFALMVFLSIFWYHGLRSVVVGQFAVIEALLITGGLWCIQRKSDPAAGILLGLAIAKPQMAFLILPFIAVWAVRMRRSQLLLSLAVTTVGLIVSSILILPGWPIQWLRQLVSYPGYTNLGSPISILVSAIPRLNDSMASIISAALLMYMVFEWIRAIQRAGDPAFQWAAAMTLTVTNLVAFRTATTNYVVLLPALILIFGSWAQRWNRRGLWAVWSVSLLLILGLWLLFLGTVDGNVEASIMYIPLPFFTFVALLWSRWWILRGELQPLTQ